MHRLARLDHEFVWHPFTQMKDWLKMEPIVIKRGKGAVLWDVHGHKYLDANSSIWTNLHGHNHPVLNRAIHRQLKRIAHSSALGLASEPSAMLAERLIQAANVGGGTDPGLRKVFYSDDGSTAMEVALKLAYEFSRRQGKTKPRFLSLAGAYHGDTIGAVSLGHIDLFHEAYRGLLFQTDKVPAPYCYRCPFNKAKPQRADARTYRKCNLECAQVVEDKLFEGRKRGTPYSAFVVEPLIQGAAGMIPQPEGWLRRVWSATREYGALLIADEVLTGFGRAVEPTPGPGTLFASRSEGVTPDLMALAKGLTGGYLPMAATLTSQRIFDAFLGDYAAFKTFFHGHSYTGNQLGASAALANLDLLASPQSLQSRCALALELETNLKTLWSIPNVGDIRRVGLIAGIELVRDWGTRAPFALEEQVGIQVCQAMARRGVLTRPIGNVVVLMPPFCTSGAQLRKITQALAESIEETCGQP